MKTYFTQLVNYDHDTNLKILDVIMKCDAAGQPTQLMAHLLVAQQVWIKRVKGEPAVVETLWPVWNHDMLRQIMNENHRALINFLDFLHPDDFDKTISYKDLKGNSYENKLSEMLAHLINHGTHHRAQAGQHLKFAGVELPVTDYIFYLRNCKQD